MYYLSDSLKKTLEKFLFIFKKRQKKYLIGSNSVEIGRRIKNSHYETESGHNFKNTLIVNEIILKIRRNVKLMK